jgi:hypothetical protein
MKNILLAFVSIVAIVSTLNTFGIINLYSKTTISSFEDPTCVKNDIVDASQAKALAAAGKEYIISNKINIKYYYFLSYQSIENLKKAADGAAGIYLTLTGSGDGLGLMAVPSGKMKCTEEDSQTSFGYVIKTFCPDMCENAD